ncbi:ABC-three component system middle component 2 [Aeromonas veronii]|uniref:ABC-three component system middle component 2 n=1 Tax=Aeromonas veronii TaxID=654 RepID=UPI001119B298|nr:ABC-three component system middle component 2 [Aeromonas veronii]KAB0673899.1 threonine transporter RhtB [Aeromonas veronii]MBS4702513.1 hypothetical protein [Aeromonas veronii]
MSKSVSVFNTSIEAGVRVIAILNAIHPQGIDFESLTKIDFIIINSSDFGGPKSLHPSTPNKIGEIASRREIVRSGIELMRRFGMIDIELSYSGVNYKATVNASPYLKLMKCNYSKSLLITAEWIARELRFNGFKKFNSTLSEMHN